MRISVSSLPVVDGEIARCVVDNCHEEGDGDEEESDRGQRVSHVLVDGRALRCGAWSIHDGSRHFTERKVRGKKIIT